MISASSEMTSMVLIAAEARRAWRMKRSRTICRPYSKEGALTCTNGDVNDAHGDGIQSRGSAFFRLLRGRDAAFLPFKPDENFRCSSLLVLDTDGTSLSVTTVISSSKSLTMEKEEDDEVRVVESARKCSLEGIVGRRVFALLGCGDDRPPEISIAGYDTTRGRPCLLLSEHRLVRADDDAADARGAVSSDRLTLVEGVGLGRRLWLRSGEEILAVVELPPCDTTAATTAEGSWQRRANNIAVATQERVMILSMSYDTPLSILAEMDDIRLTCDSLSPLGSHCVAFSAFAGHDGSTTTTKITYLSCLEGPGRRGVIATLPTRHDGRAQHDGSTLLACIRPDK